MEIIKIDNLNNFQWQQYKNKEVIFRYNGSVTFIQLATILQNIKTNKLNKFVFAQFTDQEIQNGYIQVNRHGIYDSNKQKCEKELYVKIEELIEENVNLKFFTKSGNQYIPQDNLQVIAKKNPRIYKPLDYYQHVMKHYRTRFVNVSNPIQNSWYGKGKIKLIGEAPYYSNEENKYDISDLVKNKKIEYIDLTNCEIVINSTTFQYNQKKFPVNTTFKIKDKNNLIIKKLHNNVMLDKKNNKILNSQLCSEDSYKHLIFIRQNFWPFINLCIQQSIFLHLKIESYNNKKFKVNISVWQNKSYILFKQFPNKLALSKFDLRKLTELCGKNQIELAFAANTDPQNSCSYRYTRDNFWQFFAIFVKNVSKSVLKVTDIHVNKFTFKIMKNLKDNDDSKLYISGYKLRLTENDMLEISKYPNNIIAIKENTVFESKSNNVSHSIKKLLKNCTYKVNRCKEQGWIFTIVDYYNENKNSPKLKLQFSNLKLTWQEFLSLQGQFKKKKKEFEYKFIDRVSICVKKDKCKDQHLEIEPRKLILEPNLDEEISDDENDKKEEIITIEEKPKESQKYNLQEIIKQLPTGYCYEFNNGGDQILIEIKQLDKKIIKTNDTKKIYFNEIDLDWNQIEFLQDADFITENYDQKSTEFKHNNVNYFIGKKATFVFKDIKQFGKLCNTSIIANSIKHKFAVHQEKLTKDDIDILSQESLRESLDVKSEITSEGCEFKYKKFNFSNKYFQNETIFDGKSKKDIQQQELKRIQFLADHKIDCSGVTFKNINLTLIRNIENLKSFDKTMLGENIILTKQQCEKLANKINFAPKSKFGIKHGSRRISGSKKINIQGLPTNSMFDEARIIKVTQNLASPLKFLYLHAVSNVKIWWNKYQNTGAKKKNNEAVLHNYKDFLRREHRRANQEVAENIFTLMFSIPYAAVGCGCTFVNSVSNYVCNEICNCFCGQNKKKSFNIFKPFDIKFFKRAFFGGFRRKKALKLMSKYYRHIKSQMPQENNKQQIK